MNKNRYVGDYPVIGIRPIVDGRRGPMQLRESLEPQVWAMAKAAKKLFEENLFYSNGEPVKVVLADTCIGRVPEAAACANKFKKEGVDITLSVTPCWCYGSETMDMDPQTIKGVWGFNGTERPGAVYLAAVLAGHAQKGLPAFGIYGHEVQDLDQITDIPEDVKEKLLRFGRAAVAVATMRGKSYLQIGSQCMGIAGSIVDQDMMESYFGMRVESVDEVEILRRMEEGIYDEEAFQKALAWTKEHCKEGRDDNPQSVEFLGENRRIKFTDEEKEKQWEFTVKMYCIIKDLMAGNQNLPDQFEEEKVGHNAIAGGFQGQRQWTDHWPNCDYPEALLSSTFDYEGAREPYTLATENDILNGMGMLMMRLLTHRAQIFADVRTYWSGEATERVTGYKLEGKAAESNGIIHLLNSGAACLDASGVCTDENGNAVMKKWWEVTEEDIQKMTDATVWCEAGFDNFRGGGFSSHFNTYAEMPVTMIRLNLVKGLGPVLQIAEGWTVNLPEEVNDKLMERTNPTWPCTWFAPRCDGKEGSAFKTAYEVMMNWGANHGAISYGHIGADLITMCSMLRIPVCMHNAVYISSGTWSLLGVENGMPITTPESHAQNFTNEGGAFGRYRYLKNIMGLWILQSIRRELNGVAYIQGKEKRVKAERQWSFPDLIEEAKKAEGFPSVIDVNRDCFLAPESMIETIKAECKRTSQLIPDTVAEIMQCVYTSLSLCYRDAIASLEGLTGKKYTSINIVGGGCQDGYLNEHTAKATGLPVYAGPVEGTAIGNLIVQMIANKEFENLQATRDAIRVSFDIKEVRL